MNAMASFKGKNATYQTNLYGNVQALTNFLIGSNKALSFDAPALAIRRNDGLDIPRRMLTVTLAEWKALDINKSTL